MPGAYMHRTGTISGDMYPTYHSMTRRFLDREFFGRHETFLEPAAGAYDIGGILGQYYYQDLITCLDKDPKDKDVQKHNFLSEPLNKKFDNIITNPPLKLAKEFLLTSSEIATNKICFLMPTEYLHGIERFDMFYSGPFNSFSLKTIYTFIRRPLLGYHKDKKTKFIVGRYDPAGLCPTGAQSWSWFVFKKNYKHETIHKWIDNREDMGSPTILPLLK